MVKCGDAAARGPVVRKMDWFGKALALGLLSCASAAMAAEPKMIVLSCTHGQFQYRDDTGYQPPWPVSDFTVKIDLANRKIDNEDAQISEDEIAFDSSRYKGCHGAVNRTTLQYRIQCVAATAVGTTTASCTASKP